MAKCIKNEGFCDVIMPLKDPEILKFTQHRKSIKVPTTIYTDLECLIKKI